MMADTTVPPYSRKPILLDLFCGAGGASMGYSRAGFDVVGVDIKPQPRYPFEFHQADALEYGKWATSEGFDAIHASPPCQHYSHASNCRPGLADSYPDLIGPTRALVQAIGLPFVIENVYGAKNELLHPTMLCGAMFQLKTYRHRFFEMSFPPALIGHPQHIVPTSKAGHWKPGTYVSVAGNAAPIKLAREAMGIDWMTGAELVESIPPAFTQWIGEQLLAHILERAA